MLVWCRHAAACASSWNRWSWRASIAAAKGNTLSATRRFSEICRASYTTPMPPRPTSRKIWKSPNKPGAMPGVSISTGVSEW